MLKMKKRQHLLRHDVATYKIVLMVIFMLLSSFVIGWRMLDLQIIRQDHYQRKAEDNIYRVTLDHSPRGSIFDRNGIKLAEDISSFHLYLAPSLVKNIDVFSEGIKKALIIDPEKLSSFLSQKTGPNEYLLLKANLTDEEIARFNETRFQFDPDGKAAMLKEGFKRYYPQGKLLSHVLGYTGIISEEELKDSQYRNYRPDDRIGKQGIEKFYELQLQGIKGRRIQQVDAFGRVREESIHKEVEKGEDIYLTIDSKLQSKIEKLIEGYLGTCLIIDIHQGEILACASYPDYNPNIFSGEIPEILWTELMEKRAFFNIPFQGAYAPGSTFKPLVALYALENNYIKAKERITCRGAIHMPGLEGKYGCHGIHGPVNMSEAMKVSCDVYFYELARRFSIPSFLKFVTDFGGINTPSGVDLPFESQGFLGSPQYKLDYLGYPWFDGDSMNLGIGQGFLTVTPMQLGNLYVRIANGGKKTTPHFLLRSSNQVENLKNQKKIEQYKLNKENLIELHKDLEAVVEPGGTAWKLNSSKLRIAAKTGTAQGIQSAEGEITWDLWLAAIAPIDSPEIVAIMMFENSSLEFGGNLAPLLKDAIESWFELFGSDGGKHG
jgi:penicillin-binding protein 2